MSDKLSIDHVQVETQKQEKPARATLAPWFGVLFLMLIGVLNYLDRILPAILAQPIKDDLGLSDTLLGLINGIGFLAVYAIASLPIAALSDRGRYNIVISAALGIWSLMTLVGGYVTTGWQLALSRSGVALGEAGGMPAAHAFITRHIPVKSRTTALSLFTMSLPLGAMMGFVVGGFVGEAIGWRQTFVLMGVIGLLIAILAFYMFGYRRDMPAYSTMTMETTVRLVPHLRKKSLWAILFGASFIGMGSYTAMTFTPAFLMRSHAMTVGEAGVSFGLSGGFAGIVGLIIIGLAADKLAARDERWLLGVVVALFIGTIPFSIGAYLVPHTGIAMVGLAITLAVAMVYAAPVIAALHRLVPIELRARASALLMLSTSILGGLGPVVAGAISDALQPSLGSNSLARAMLVVPAAYTAALLCFAAALPFFASEVVDEDEQLSGAGD